MFLWTGGIEFQSHGGNGQRGRRTIEGFEGSLVTVMKKSEENYD